MKLVTDPKQFLPPKAKPKPDPFANAKPYQDLLTMIAHNKFGVQQQIRLEFGPNDAELYGVEDPQRTAADRIKKFLRARGLAADYTVARRTTNVTGVNEVRVTYEPPMSSSAPRQKTAKKRSA